MLKIKASTKVRPEEELKQQWLKIQTKWGSVPKFAGKYGSATRLPVKSKYATTNPVQLIASSKGASPYHDDHTKLNKEAAARTAFVEQHGVEEWEARQAKAKETVHTVVPLHKSNYILVTDMSLIPGMVSKSNGK